MSTTSHIRIQNIVSIILNSRSKMMLQYIFFELWFMLPNVFFSWNQAYGLNRLQKVYSLKYNNYYKIFLALAKTICRQSIDTKTIISLVVSKIIHINFSY